MLLDYTTDRKSTRLNSSHQATTYIYILSLLDALPIWGDQIHSTSANYGKKYKSTMKVGSFKPNAFGLYDRSEEHTSELQSPGDHLYLHSFPTRRSSDLG